MPPSTLTGKELPEDEFWAEGSFIESCSNEDWELKKRTFHLKHNEEIKNPNRSRAAGYLISWDFLILTGIINNRCRAQDKETTLSVHK